MNPADWGSIASAAVALVALIISWVSLQKTSKFNERQDEFAETAENLNRLLIEREAQASRDSKRADLSANIITVGNNKWRLKVFNRGQGTAKNVRLTDLQEPPAVLAQNVIKHKFPVPILEQHQSVEVAAIHFMAGPSRAHIKLVWDDESGVGHEKELTPSF